MKQRNFIRSNAKVCLKLVCLTCLLARTTEHKIERYQQRHAELLSSSYIRSYLSLNASVSLTLAFIISMRPPNAYFISVSLRWSPHWDDVRKIGYAKPFNYTLEWATVTVLYSIPWIRFGGFVLPLLLFIQNQLLNLHINFSWVSIMWCWFIHSCFCS